MPGHAPFPSLEAMLEPSELERLVGRQVQTVVCEDRDIDRGELPEGLPGRRADRLATAGRAVSTRPSIRYDCSHDAVIVVPSSWRVGWWLNRLSPSLGVYLARKDYEDTLKRSKA